MAKEHQNDAIWAGDDVEITFTVEDMDYLIGATIRWQLSENVNGEVKVEKSTSDGISVDGDEFIVIVNADDTKNLSGVYFHEAEIVDSEGRYSTVAQGHLEIKPTLI